LSNSQTSLPRPKGVHVLSATTTLSVRRLRLARASRRSRNRVVPRDRNARARRQFRPVSRPRCSRRRVDTDVDCARRAPLHQFRLDQGNTPKQLMRRSPDIMILRTSFATTFAESGPGRQPCIGARHGRSPRVRYAAVLDDEFDARRLKDASDAVFSACGVGRTSPAVAGWPVVSAEDSL
jgi:hypothetical protein